MVEFTFCIDKRGEKKRVSDAWKKSMTGDTFVRIPPFPMFKICINVTMLEEKLKAQDNKSFKNFSDNKKVGFLCVNVDMKYD